MNIAHRLLMSLPADATPEERLALLREQLFLALEDGRLTVAELQALRATRVALGLSVEQSRGLRAEVYHAALQRAQRDDRLSPLELETLNQIMQFFNTLKDEA